MNPTEGEDHGKVRKMLADEADALAAITARSPGAARWTQKMFQKLSGTGERTWVIESGGRIRGFLVARIVVNEAEILNMAVDPSARRLGQATALLRESLTELCRAGAHGVFLEVRASNAVAIAFYRKEGFEAYATRPGYYQDPPEAALCMKKKLTG